MTLGTAGRPEVICEMTEGTMLDELPIGRSEIAGTEIAGRETAGEETAGKETAGEEIAGTETAGTETDGTEVAGTEIAEVNDGTRDVSAGTCGIRALIACAGRLRIGRRPARPPAPRMLIGTLTVFPLRTLTQLKLSRFFKEELALLKQLVKRSAKSSTYEETSSIGARELLRGRGTSPASLPSSANSGKFDASGTSVQLSRRSSISADGSEENEEVGELHLG